MNLTSHDILAVADVIFEAAQEAQTPAVFKKVSAKDLQARELVTDGALSPPISPCLVA